MKKDRETPLTCVFCGIGQLVDGSVLAIDFLSCLRHDLPWNKQRDEDRVDERKSAKRRRTKEEISSAGKLKNGREMEEGGGRPRAATL